jgi:ankyrin repeat protein
MDPLIHVAVLNPDVLPVLWELFPQPLENAKSLDIEVDPNTPNHFGKTPLMVAAQQNQLKSAKLLLDRGASLERTTFKKGDAMGDPELAHDARTALMYAAARGSLEMIRLLVDRGADKHAADTKGRRALHYLLGQGPVAANTTLSAVELAEAAMLLY